MNKKMLLLTIGLGVISFTGAFFAAYFTGKKEPEQATAIPAPAEATKEPSASEQLDSALASTAIVSEQTSMVLTERHLKNLIHSIQDKMNEYKQKLAALNTQEEQIKITHRQLAKDINDLTRLRTEVASMIASLKQERDLLLKTRVEIEQSEKDNIMLIAATYDKMNATNAGEIFTNMCKISEPGVDGFKDVVKILYYMNERNKAKVLAEMVNTEPKLAAVLSQELKKIREVAQ